MKSAQEPGSGPKSARKLIIWLAVAAVAAAALVVVGIKAYRILCAPRSLFNVQTMDPARLSTTQPAPAPADTGSGEKPAVEPTPEPTPGITEGKDILNILLIGVDRREGEAESGGINKGGNIGTDPHADVQMVVAVNFKEKRADLISLPRDTIVHSPELMPGVYKLNATFNVGGGFADPDAAFRKVCEGAEYMLGGMPVDYYYAVDFKALVSLVDAVGGVDFDVESRSYSRQRKTGMQHMDGEDVLYYVRRRKTGPAPGDLNRINRQKELLIAIFDQLTKNGKLSMVPDLIGAVNNGVHTNTNLEQTLALVNFAKSIDSKNIGMRSMSGPIIEKLFWNWCFTDQKKRIALIREVYGADVPELARCSVKYTDWLDQYGFTCMVYLKNAKQVLDYAESLKAQFTEEQRQAYDALAASFTQTQAAWDLASFTLKSADTNAMYKSYRKVQADATALAKLLDYKETLKWSYRKSGSAWCHDRRINEVWVDFR